MNYLKKPTFILCVGAQKTGTSWLHKQLNSLSTVNFGLLKEYHIWDALYVVHCNRWIAKQTADENALNVLRRLMQSVEGVYESYFHSLISETVQYTGDFTPSYSILNGEQFLLIKGRLESIGFKVKVIFLMRDPVLRNWSALRFYNRSAIQSGQTKTEDIVEQFPNFYKTPGAIDRTNYQKTVLALREAFPEKDVFIGFYETLFEEKSRIQLSEFLEINLENVNTEEKVNSSKKLTLPEKEYNACKEYYSELYEFCRIHFPQTQQLWSR